MTEHSAFDGCWLPKIYGGPLPADIHEAAVRELSSLDVPFRLERGNGGDAVSIRNDNGTYVISGGETGVLYGAFKLRTLLKLGADFTEISERPSFDRRIINHWDNMDGSIERGYSGGSLFFADNEVRYDRERVWHYARLLASVGINTVAVNNVNVKKEALSLITEENLPKVAELAAVFRAYGIRLILSVNYASPVLIGGLSTADPLDNSVADWWGGRFKLIYSRIPDLFGVLVKADSENQPGPFTYDRNHADGANLLAKAIAPYGGTVFWRCFVYNCKQDWRDAVTDRPKFPYENFMPLDGLFESNVVLQIKNGPYDFQIREPVSPLLGRMPQTTQAVEFQIAQEYTGHQIDLCFLPSLWREVLDEGFTVSHIAAVANTGGDFNWTGNYLAAANLFGYGRMAWDKNITPEIIAREWCGLMFDNAKARDTVAGMLLKSRDIYERYTTPMGMGWFVSPMGHYGPSPMGYEFSKWGTYHKAGKNALGIDRSSKGTGYAQQYPPEQAALYDSLETCPEDLLLFFHRVPYGFALKNGNTLLQHLYDCHFTGAEDAEKLLNDWESLEGLVPDAVYQNVLERLNLQKLNAYEWRDVFNTFFRRLTGTEDAKGRKIYE